MTGSKRVDHWTSGTVYECSEIAGSPHLNEKYWEFCYRPGLLFISKNHYYERSYNQFQGLHNIWIGCACANWHNLEKPSRHRTSSRYHGHTIRILYGTALYHTAARRYWWFTGNPALLHYCTNQQYWMFRAAVLYSTRLHRIVCLWYSDWAIGRF